MNLLSWLKLNKNIHKEPRMYIIIRGDLDQSLRFVQGSHALVQFAMEHPEEFKQWNNQYLIFLKVFNLISLYQLLNRFNKTPMSVFKEPDLDGQLTAVAVYDNGKLVQDLPLA